MKTPFLPRPIMIMSDNRNIVLPSHFFQQPGKYIYIKKHLSCLRRSLNSISAVSRCCRLASERRCSVTLIVKPPLCMLIATPPPHLFLAPNSLLPFFSIKIQTVIRWAHRNGGWRIPAGASPLLQTCSSCWWWWLLGGCELTAPPTPTLDIAHLCTISYHPSCSSEKRLDEKKNQWSNQELKVVLGVCEHWMPAVVLNQSGLSFQSDRLNTTSERSFGRTVAETSLWTQLISAHSSLDNVCLYARK